MIPMRHNWPAPVNLGPTAVFENHHSSAAGVVERAAGSRFWPQGPGSSENQGAKRSASMVCSGGRTAAALANKRHQRSFNGRVTLIIGFTDPEILWKARFQSGFGYRLAHTCCAA
jgi:hypothetical protein